MLSTAPILATVQLLAKAKSHSANNAVPFDDLILKWIKAWRCFFLFCFLLSFSIPSSAAKRLILDEQAHSIKLYDYLDVLYDHQHRFSVSDIHTKDEIKRKFAPLQTSHLRLKKNSTLWLRFGIVNNSSDNMHRWIHITPFKPDTLKLYQVKNSPSGLPTQSLTDRTVAISDAGSVHTEGIYHIDLPPNRQQYFYLAMQSDEAKELRIELIQPSVLMDHIIDDATWVNLGIGALLLLFVASIVTAIAGQSRVTAAHGIYILALCGISMLISGYFFPSLQDSASQRNLFISCCLLTCSLTLTYISQRLLVPNRHSTSWNVIFSLQYLINCLTLACIIIWHIHFVIMLLMLSVSIGLFGITMMTNYLNMEDKLALALLNSKLIFSLVAIGSFFADKWGMLNFDKIYVLNLLVGETIVNTFLYHMRLYLLSRKRHKHSQLLAIAEAEVHSQGELLNKISHDIRTPISGVMGMSELLLDTPLTANQRDHVETIQSSGQALLNLVNETFDHSRIDPGKVDIKNSAFEISNLINECTDSFRAHAEQKNIELISNIADNVPAVVSGDPARLRQIIIQLLKNAFDHTDRGEVILTVSLAKRLQHHILFSVKDTGRGLSQFEKEQLLKQITSDIPLKGRAQNNQLNLAIAQRLVTRMQGKSGVSSELGHGADFWFSVPLPAQLLSGEAESNIEDMLRHKHMLVVDDNETCRKLIQQQGTGWGMQVYAAQNGSEAYAIMRTKQNLKEHFDVILIDYNMPGISGLQLAAKITNDSMIEPKPLLLMLTGVTQTPLATAARQNGIRRILSKPVTGKALKITLAEELSFKANKELQHDSNANVLDQTLSGIKLNVLVAEDNPVSQKVITSMLRKIGAESKTVNNGLQALEAVQRQRYDIILMDCEMPVMDGFKASQAIRQWQSEQNLKPTPIVALTAHIMDEHKEKSLSSGMNAHLSKPVELAQLQQTLKHFIDARPS